MKKAAYILLTFILLFFAACQSVDHAEKPKNLIAEDKMIDVLTDLLKLDAAESFSSIEYEKREVSTKELIFKKYKIDSLQFVKSSEYYAEDFKTNERIYDSVRARLENEKNVLDSLVDQEREEEKAERAKKKEDKIKSLEVNKKRDSSSGRMLIKPQS